MAFTSARAALFILSSFIALTFSHATQGASSGEDVDQPTEGKDARRMISEEQEEELLDEESFGLTVPAGAPRPALIIVMVSRSRRERRLFTKLSLSF